MNTHKAQRFWNRVSKIQRNPTELGAVARTTIGFVSGFLTDESVVLDIGCGPGDLTIAIAHKTTYVYAIDTSSGMIEVAKNKAKVEAVNNVDFATTDLFALAEKSGAFTVVTALNVLPYMEDVAGACKCINGLLATEGVFISSTACLGERKSFLSLLTAVLTKLRIMPDIHFFKLSELKKLVTSAGFEIIETKRISSLPEYCIVARKIAE